jgi:hypothetical protein
VYVLEPLLSFGIGKKAEGGREGGKQAGRQRWTSSSLRKAL